MIKIPSLVLSAWSEWAQAEDDIVNVDPSRVETSDERVLTHSWHQANVETRPSTPSAEGKAFLKKYVGMYSILSTNHNMN
jgi:hypothetical protein